MTESTNGFELNEDATLALQIDRLMRRFHSDLHPRAQAVDQEKIGPTTAQEISETLGRDKSQVSRVIGLLTRKGLVQTTTHERDARSVSLRLSKQGTLQLAAFNGAMVETTKSVLGPLSQDEVRQFSALLTKVLSAKP